MANTTTTPNMGLVIPIAGMQLGPTYALNVNAALEKVDGHNHSSGSGRKVPTAGLNINAPLNFNAFWPYNLFQATFASNSAASSTPSSVSSVTTSGANGDLYWTDGMGNRIRLTAGGSPVGTPGSITGMNPPAAVVYNSGFGRFTFYSNLGTPQAASLAALAIAFSANGAGPQATLTGPASLSAGAYTLKLPAGLPGSEVPLFVGSTGVTQARAIAVGDLPTAQLAPVANKVVETNSDGFVDNALLALDSASGPAGLDANTRLTPGRIVRGRVSCGGTIAWNALGFSVAYGGGGTQIVVTFTDTPSGMANSQYAPFVTCIDPGLIIGNSPVFVITPAIQASMTITAYDPANPGVALTLQGSGAQIAIGAIA